MKRKLTLAMVGLLAFGASVVGADSAFATPTRAACGYDYLQVLSNRTTCWANAGNASVKLYSVTGAWGGNNAGHIWGYGNHSGASSTTYFIKYHTSYVPDYALYGATDTIYTIHID